MNRLKFLKYFTVHCATVILFSICQSKGADFPEAEAKAKEHGQSAIESSAATINQGDLKNFLERLASEEYEGRGTGDKGERMATAYLASFFEGLGLTPAGNDGTYFQEFGFNAGKEMNSENQLTIQIHEPLGLVRTFEPGQHYLPVNFSVSGEMKPTRTVFAGFGIQNKEYNSFENLNVKDAWVLVFRGSPKDRKELQKFGPLVNKAQQAKKLGARGIIYIKGPNPGVGKMLVPPSQNVGSNNEILPAMTISDELAGSLLGGTDNGSFKDVFESFYSGKKVGGFPLPYSLSAQIGLTKKEDKGRNVIARLKVKENPSEEAIMVGGHIDHLGLGTRGGTRAKGKDTALIHYGADDNASGISAIMELAQFYADLKNQGKFELKRDIIFAAWSGEEMGLFGSKHFVKKQKEIKGDGIYPSISAYLNLDMIGRLKENPLIVHGTGSSKAWNGIVDSIEGEMKIEKSESPYLPTDSTPIYNAGVPILALFTGLHDDYHTPADTPDKIDYAGLLKVTNYLQSLTTATANQEIAPDYVKVKK
ncbi:MAG: M28 family peptidase [Verrucomicrobiales bacterium]|nr:M28 family peptidase [Verrucomicrobiales bacterium]